MLSVNENACVCVFVCSLDNSVYQLKTAAAAAALRLVKAANFMHDEMHS
jgi:hypothetical protein